MALVAWWMGDGETAQEMTLGDGETVYKVLDEGRYGGITIEAGVAKRTSKGGASPASIAAQIEYLKQVTA